MSAAEYKAAFLDAVLGLLWRQWSGLGVAAQVPAADDARVLDPEALLIASSVFCRYDQRLFDLAASWLVKYGLLVNPTRLKALVRKMHWGDGASLAYLAALRAQSGDKRWQRPAEQEASGATGLRPMFLHAGGESPVYCRQRDELAARYGLLRSPFEYRDKLSRALPDSAATLLLRMRGMYGVSARADVIMHLLHAPATIQQLSDLSGFARSSVKEVLQELEAGNAVYAVERSRRNTAYALAHGAALRGLFGCESSRLVPWGEVFACLGRLWDLISNPLMERVSADTFRGELRLVFQEHVQPCFLTCGIRSLQHLTADTLHLLPAAIRELGLVIKE